MKRVERLEDKGARRLALELGTVACERGEQQARSSSAKIESEGETKRQHHCSGFLTCVSLSEAVIGETKTRREIACGRCLLFAFMMLAFMFCGISTVFGKSEGCARCVHIKPLFPAATTPVHPVSALLSSPQREADYVVTDCETENATANEPKQEK